MHEPGSLPDPRPRRVSAIVSTYRAERFMRGRLENLVGQTLFAAGELEIVVVDAHSPEKERTIVQDFQDRYPNIHYVRTAERETVYQAWNRGIRMASGRYITNQNTDDRMRLDALERLADYLDAHPDVAMVHADQVQVPSGEQFDLETYRGPGHFQWHAFSRIGLVVSTQAGSQPMWRRSLHDKFGLFDESYVILGDQEFFLRASAGGDYHFIPEVLGTLDYRPDSVSRNVSAGNAEWLRIFQTYTGRDRIAGLLGVSVHEPLNDDLYQALINNFVCLLALETVQKPGLPFPKAPLDLLIQAVSLGRHNELVTRNLLRIVSQLLEPSEAQRILTPQAQLKFGAVLEVAQAHPGLELLPLPNMSVGLPEPIRSLRPRRQSRPPASLVVVTYNSARTIEQCVESTLQTMGPDDEILLIDNASQDETPRLLAELTKRDGRVRHFLSSENLGFSAGTNLGLQRAKGEHLVLLNPDTVPYPGWLEEMAYQAQLKGVGAVGPTSDYVAGRQKWPLYAPDLPHDMPHDQLAQHLMATQHHMGIDTKLLIGFCMLFPRSVLDRIGFLDEALFLGNDDLDISWRLQLAGYRLRVATGAFVHHIGQVSFNSEPSERTRRLVQESTDALARKLVRHYGPGGVPSSTELWDMGWFSPTPGILEGEPEASEPLPGMLPDLKGFNILVAEREPGRMVRAVTAYLEAFEPSEDVALHVLAGDALVATQEAVLAAIGELGLDPERVPDISLLDLAPTPDALSAHLPSVDLVLAAEDVAATLRTQGMPALTEVTPERLAAARDLGRMDGSAPPLVLDGDARERWLVTGPWQRALEAYLEAASLDQSVALVIGVERGGEAESQTEIATWLASRGIDPDRIPDVLIVERGSDMPLFRAATAWIDSGQPRDRTRAESFGLRILPPNADAMRSALSEPAGTGL